MLRLGRSILSAHLQVVWGCPVVFLVGCGSQRSQRAMISESRSALAVGVYKQCNAEGVGKSVSSTIGARISIDGTSTKLKSEVNLWTLPERLGNSVLPSLRRPFQPRPSLS